MAWAFAETMHWQSALFKLQLLNCSSYGLTGQHWCLRLHCYMDCLGEFWLEQMSGLDAATMIASTYMYAKYHACIRKPLFCVQCWRNVWRFLLEWQSWICSSAPQPNCTRKQAMAKHMKCHNWSNLLCLCLLLVVVVASSHANTHTQHASNMKYYPERTLNASSSA